jgi:hypothetical protein
LTLRASKFVRPRHKVSAFAQSLFDQLRVVLIKPIATAHPAKPGAAGRYVGDPARPKVMHACETDRTPAIVWACILLTYNFRWQPYSKLTAPSSKSRHERI